MYNRDLWLHHFFEQDIVFTFQESTHLQLPSFDSLLFGCCRYQASFTAASTRKCPSFPRAKDGPWSFVPSLEVEIWSFIFMLSNTCHWRMQIWLQVYILLFQYYHSSLFLKSPPTLQRIIWGTHTIQKNHVQSSPSKDVPKKLKKTNKIEIYFWT